jgi:hypothetical protein
VPATHSAAIASLGVGRIVDLLSPSSHYRNRTIAPYQPPPIVREHSGSEEGEEEEEELHRYSGLNFDDTHCDPLNRVLVSMRINKYVRITMKEYGYIIC